MMILSPFKYEEPENVRFRLLADLQIDLKLGLFLSHELYLNDRLIATIHGDVLTIKKGFEWDGATPKRKILGLWVGTPDFNTVRLPSCVHDVLCVLVKNGFDDKITQRDADNVSTTSWKKENQSGLIFISLAYMF